MVTRISDETAARAELAWPDILAGVASGKRLAVVAGEHGLNGNEVWAFRRRDASGVREQEWQAARYASADAFLEMILETIDNPALDPSHARVRCDALKWAAAKRNPDHYSDRQRVDVSHTVDIRPALEQAAARAARLRAWYADRDALTLDPGSVTVVREAPVVHSVQGGPAGGTPPAAARASGGRGTRHTPKDEAAAPERGGQVATRAKNLKNNFEELI